MPLADLVSEPENDVRIQRLIQQYLEQNPGSSTDAWHAAMQDRQVGDNADPNLRNAEHALFSQSLFGHDTEAGPGGGLANLAKVPLYSALKWGAQNLPWELGAIPRAIGRQQLGHDLTRSTPPSWSEVKWGLAPLWGGVSRQGTSGP